MRAPALSNRLGTGENRVAPLLTVFSAGALIAAFGYQQLRALADH